MAGTAAALFDVDGTLVDSTYLHTVSWWETLREYGHTVPMALIGRSIGLGTEQLLDHVLGPDRDKDETDALDTAHKALYSRFWPTLTPLPGATELLRACADRGWTVVLASSASARELEVLRKVLDADDAITAATGADDVRTGKPAPDVVETALEKVGADPERSVMIGDTVWDVEAAGRAGLRCITVHTGGFSAAELTSAGAAGTYRDAAEILARIDDSLLAKAAR